MIMLTMTGRARRFRIRTTAWARGQVRHPVPGAQKGRVMPAKGSTPRGGFEPRPRVLLLELRERTSEKGWLGRANVIAFAEQDPEEQDRIVWKFYVEPGAGACR